jgi:hypothetical protein
MGHRKAEHREREEQELERGEEEGRAGGNEGQPTRLFVCEARQGKGEDKTTKNIDTHNERHKRKARTRMRSPN